VEQLDLKKIAKLIVGVVALIFLLSYTLGGLTHVNPGETTILIKNFGSNSGMQKRVLDTGTHWVEPFLYDVATYDTRLRQYPLEDTEASTQDGQPISVDVSLEIGLVQGQVPNLHQQVGTGWYEQVVKPSAIAALRQATASVLSDAVYTGAGRITVQTTAERTLKEKYDALGIRIDFNVRDVQFVNKAFVETLEKKASATQQEIIEKRLAEAAIQEAIKVANIAEGLKQKAIKEAEARREEQRLAGEGSRLLNEETAKGNLALAKADAEGTKLRREALAGAGGPEMVSIEWARQMGPNIKVYGFPTGSPGTTSIMPIENLFKGAFAGAK